MIATADEKNQTAKSDLVLLQVVLLRAGDEIRTRDVNLGKVALYH